MSVRFTTTDGITGKVALYCSTDGIAFGPVFDSEDAALDFLDHLEEIGERDPRDIPALELAELHNEWSEELGDSYPVNRGTPARDLDGYTLDDPKRGTLERGNG